MDNGDGRRRAAKVVRIAARVVGIGFAVAALVPLLAILYARTERGRETVRRLAVAQAQKALPGLTIGKIEGDYVHDLALRDVDVRDRQGRKAIHVDRIAARYRVLAVLRRTVAVDELRVEGVRVVAAPDPGGALNLSRLTAPAPAGAAQPPAPPSQSSPWRIHVDKIAVSDVTGTIETPDGTTGTLGGLRIEGGVHLDGDRLRAWLDEAAAGASFDGRSYALSLTGAEAALTPSDVAVKIPSARFAGLLPGDAPIELRADAVGPRERIEAKVDVHLGRAGALSVRGHAGAVSQGQGRTTLGAYDVVLRATGIEPARLVAGGPDGQVAFVVSARGHGLPPAQDARATIDLQLLDSRLAGVRIEDSRLSGSIDGDRWEVPPGALRASGATLTLAGQGRGPRLTGDVGLTLDGPALRPAGVDVRGRGRVALHVDGTIPDDLAIQSRGNVRGLRVQTLSVGALTLALDARVKPSAAPAGSFRVGARRVGLGAAAPQIDSVTLDASGSPGGTLRARAALAVPCACRPPRTRGPTYRSTVSRWISPPAATASSSTSNGRPRFDTARATAWRSSTWPCAARGRSSPARRWWPANTGCRRRVATRSRN